MNKLPQKLLPVLLFLFLPLVALALTLTLGNTQDNAWNQDNSVEFVGQSFLAVAGDYTSVTINKQGITGIGHVISGSIQADSAGNPSETGLATFSSPTADQNGDFTY